MKLKSFKRFIKESDDKNALNSFIENTFQGNWGKTKTDFGTFTDEYSCKDGGTLSRIIFFPRAEMAQLSRLSDLKLKLDAFLAKENEGHPRFYTKDDYTNIPDHLSFLASIGQKIHGYTDNDSEANYMGIIFTKQCAGNDNVDFSNYDGGLGNSEINTRIERTKPVLSVNPTSAKIIASFEFERDGWTLNPINKALEDNINNAPVEPEVPEEETNPEGEEEQTK